MAGNHDDQSKPKEEPRSRPKRNLSTSSDHGKRGLHRSFKSKSERNLMIPKDSEHHRHHHHHHNKADPAQVRKSRSKRNLLSTSDHGRRPHSSKSKSNRSLMTMDDLDHHRDNEPDPTQVLMCILKVKKHCNISVHEFDELEGFWRQPTTRDYESFTHPVVNAARAGDIATLRRLHEEEGLSLSCCSRTKDSLLHLACRKGQTEVVKFLVEDLRVPVNVADSCGKTPAHDACWQRGPDPELEILEVLCSKCPDLLFIKDERGHTPMQYAPKNHWKQLVQHFSKNIAAVKPKYLKC